MKSRSRRILAASLIVASLAFAASPAAADDRQDIEAAISSQLNAFRADDGVGAYSFAAPNITSMFPTAESFMAMVQRGYDQVYRSSNVTFGPMTPEGAGFRQEVYLTDQGGQSWIASYTLQRQPDGSMKITGVQIRKGDDLSA